MKRCPFQDQEPSMTCTSCHKTLKENTAKTFSSDDAGNARIFQEIKSFIYQEIQAKLQSKKHPKHEIHESPNFWMFYTLLTQFQ